MRRRAPNGRAPPCSRRRACRSFPISLSTRARRTRRAQPPESRTPPQSGEARPGSFAAEKLPERLEKPPGKRGRFLPKVLEFLGKLGLGAAVNFAGHRRHLVIRQRYFVGGGG